MDDGETISCEECHFGYFLKDFKEFSNKTLKKCLSCDNAEGFYIDSYDNQTSNQICRKCNETLSDCIICNSSTNCIKCAPNFYLKMVTFSQSSELTTSCVSDCGMNISLVPGSKNNGFGVCLYCPDGLIFDYQSSKCMKPLKCQMENCNYCLGHQENCGECNSGYSLNCSVPSISTKNISDCSGNESYILS